MFRVSKIIKNGGRNIPRYSIQTIKYYDKSSSSKDNINNITTPTNKDKKSFLSNSIRNEINDINNNIRDNDNKLYIKQQQEQQLEEDQKQQHKQQQYKHSQRKPKSLNASPFKILSYKSEMNEPKEYIDPTTVIRRDFNIEEYDNCISGISNINTNSIRTRNIDTELYPTEKLPFNQGNKDQADYIQNLIYKKGIQKAIIEFHNSLFQDADVNFFSFSFLLSSIALENGIDKSVDYFKYYVNEHYRPFLYSYRFLYYLRLIYKYNPISVETIYNFLLKSNLIDIKMTLYFCTFYLEVNLEDKAINLINNNFKKVITNNEPISNTTTIKKNSKNEPIKLLEDLWNFNYKDQLLFMNEPVMKFNKLSEDYHKLMLDFNKLFTVSGSSLRFYQTISNVFLPDGRITSKKSLPSLIQFSNLCLHFGHTDLLNQVYKPYKEDSSSNSTTAQLMGMIYFYTQNRNLVELKKYIYDQFISPNSNNTWRFKEILLNTWIYCNLEVNDYGEALRSLDIKNHFQNSGTGNTNGISDRTIERVDYNSGFLDPFIGYHNYLSEVINVENIKDNHLKARDFWKLKQNQIIKIKQQNPIAIVSSNNQDGSSVGGYIQSSKYPIYIPYDAPDLIKQSDQLLEIKKIEGALLKFPRRYQTKVYQSELSIIISKLKQTDTTPDFLNLIQSFYTKLNQDEFSKILIESSESESSSIKELDKKITNNYYFRVPHSLLFIVSIQQYRNQLFGNGINNENEEKLIEYFKFISTLCKPLQNLFTVKNDWYLYLISNPDINGLNLMTQSLPQSIYKSADFYNFWLHKISEIKKPVYVPLSWKLIKYMVNESIPIYRKSLLMFSDFIIKSEQPIINKDYGDDDSSSFEILNKIEINNPWLERDILNVLKWKLRIFPNNEYSSDNINSLDKKQLEQVFKESKLARVKTTSLVELQVQLVSRIYPIPPISNFQYWLDIGKDLHDDCKITFIRTICQCLVRIKQYKQLDSFLESNLNMIGSISIAVFKDIFENSLPPIKQAHYICNNLKEFTSYKSSFVQYIKDLKLKLFDNNLIDQVEYNSKFLKLDIIISKERLSKYHKDEYPTDTTTTPNQEQKDFETLFSKIYLN